MGITNFQILTVENLREEIVEQIEKALEEKGLKHSFCPECQKKFEGKVREELLEIDTTERD